MTPSNGPTPRGARRPEALWYGTFLLALGALPLLTVHLIDYLHTATLPVLTPAAEDAQHRSMQAILLIAGYLTAAALTTTGRKWARVAATGLAGFAVFGAAMSIGDALNYATLYGVSDPVYAFAAATALTLSTIGLVLLYQAPVNAYLNATTTARRQARASASAARRAQTGQPLYLTGREPGRR